MKIIILAAGQGKRLFPLTNCKPKCMVNFHGKPLIDYILDSVSKCNINNIAVVSGYKSYVLRKYLTDKKIKFFENKNYKNTNMVSTFFCAKDFMDDDLIISYSDIVYKSEILQKLINSKNDFNVVVDKDWKKLWSIRMGNPLNDAETLKIKNGKIVELGKKPNGYNDIEGQYIGLIKINKKILKKVINFYEGIETDLGKNNNKIFDNMYMTTFIQMIIDKLLDVYPTYVRGGWFEIDSVNDLKQMEKKFNKFLV